MDELLKIAENGQWTLEKSANKKLDAQRLAQVQAYMNNKAQAKLPVAQPTAQSTGLRPAQTSSGANPTYTKEQVAAIRAGIAPEKGASSTPAPTPTPADKRAKVIQGAQKGMEREQTDADSQAKTTQDRKAAWEAGVAFLAQHGSKGYQALQQQMQQKKTLDQAHQSGKMPVKPKAELMLPQEMVRDGNGVGSMQPRQGRYHGEGATTTGKIVTKRASYPTKEVDASGNPIMAHTSRPQQEQHHWAWDHNKKNWNHVKTTHVSPASTGGGSSSGPTIETVKRGAPRPAAEERAEWKNKQLRDNED